MTTKTDRHRHIDLVLRTRRKPPLIELVRSLQADGRSLRKISADVLALTDEYVSPATILAWLNEAEAEATTGGAA